MLTEKDFIEPFNTQMHGITLVFHPTQCIPLQERAPPFDLLTQLGQTSVGILNSTANHLAWVGGKLFLQETPQVGLVYRSLPLSKCRCVSVGWGLHQYQPKDSD